MVRINNIYSHHDQFLLFVVANLYFHLFMSIYLLLAAPDLLVQTLIICSATLKLDLVTFKDSLSYSQYALICNITSTTTAQPTASPHIPKQ